MVSDPIARERVAMALREEGLSLRIVAAKDFSLPGLEGAPVAALVYDLAPWNAAALAFLRQQRGFPSPVPDLPVLLYAPQRPEVAQLLVEAGRLSMVWGEMQFGRDDEVRRLRHSIRRVLAVAPAAVVFRLLMFYLPDLPGDVAQFCRRACGELAAGRGNAVTVSTLSKDLGVERRTLERRWREYQLAPKEFLDWITLVFAAHIADRRCLEIDEVGELLGMDPRRMQRCRSRLKASFKIDRPEDVLVPMSRRLGRIRVPRPRPETDLRGELVPLYEAGGV